MSLTQLATLAGHDERWAKMKYLMQIHLVGFLLVLTISSAHCEPLTIPENKSPDKKFSLIVTHMIDKATKESSPMLTLRDNVKGKDISSVSIDIDETDSRKSIDALWSPNSLWVAVNTHLGQLYNYTVYSISDGALLGLTLQPMPEKLVAEYFTPETTKSRGGAQVLNWLGPTTFVTEDTMYSVEITYQITKDQKINAIQVKQKPEKKSNQAVQSTP